TLHSRISWCRPLTGRCSPGSDGPRAGHRTVHFYGGIDMKLWWRLAVAGLAVVWLGGFVYAVRPAGQAQMTASPQGKKAGEYFKNVTTSTLKELSVDDFIFAMGVIADDLGLDCADCHPDAGTDKVNWVVDTNQKRTARRMVEMVAVINRTN